MISKAFQKDFDRVGVVRLASVLDFANHLAPALSPDFVGGEGGSVAVLPNNVRLGWSFSHEQNEDLAMACSFLQERKLLRVRVRTNHVFH